MIDPATMAAYRAAIAGMESSGNYRTVGRFTKGDRPYGKYGVMGVNVPVWTAAALGRPMTPEEFLANPAAQDATFNARFGGYVNRYGPEGAAQAWLGGPGSVGKTGRADVLGTSVGDYGRKFISSAAPNLAMQFGQAAATGAGQSFGDVVAQQAAQQAGVAPPSLPDLALTFLQQAQERQQREAEQDQKRRQALFAPTVAVAPSSSLAGLYG